MLSPKASQTAVAARWASRILQADSSLEAIDQRWLGLAAIHLEAAVPSMTPLMMHFSGDATEYRSKRLVTFNPGPRTMKSSWLSQSIGPQIVAYRLCP
jgi:hypothetical protein